MALLNLSNKSFSLNKSIDFAGLNKFGTQIILYKLIFIKWMVNTYQIIVIIELLIILKFEYHYYNFCNLLFNINYIIFP